MVFEKGHEIRGGRPKGSKNRITNDVRQAFHKVYDEMGKDFVDEKGVKRPLSGHEAMLMWARTNPTEFYRLYGKMIPATAELPADIHEDFVDELIFTEEMPKLVEAKDVTDMGQDDQKQLTNGVDIPQDGNDNAPLDKAIDYMP